MKLEPHQSSIFFQEKIKFKENIYNMTQNRKSKNRETEKEDQMIQNWLIGDARLYPY